MLSYLHIIFSDLDKDRKFSIFGALTVLAVPSSIVNEISTFFNQFDGAITFSVIIILNQLITIRWSLWWSEAVAILNGKALGEREANKTKLCMKLRVVNSVLLSSGLAAASYYLMSYQVPLFLSDNDFKSIFMATSGLSVLLFL